MYNFEKLISREVYYFLNCPWCQEFINVKDFEKYKSSFNFECQKCSAKSIICGTIDEEGFSNNWLNLETPGNPKLKKDWNIEKNINFENALYDWQVERGSNFNREE